MGATTVYLFYLLLLLLRSCRRFCAAGRRRRLKRLHGLHHAAPGYGAELGLFALLYAELARAQGQLDWVQLVLLHA